MPFLLIVLFASSLSLKFSLNHGIKSYALIIIFHGFRGTCAKTM